LVIEKLYKRPPSSGHVVAGESKMLRPTSKTGGGVPMLGEENPVAVALKESREEIAALSEFLCSEGFWSDEEAQKMIAETRDLAPVRL
jgi:hypothetical protein